MSHTSSESDSSSSLKDQAESPFIYESNCEGSLSGGDGSLKKGPWTSAEDAILVDYVKKHGEGNWNAVRKHSGLLRCGKSCRLRWINHLRPDLKKGAFTPDEEQLIIQLHAKMGNKWAKMAAHLPGRTDNEIKNYWNTRIKRRQRAGLPLYPTITCSQLLKNQSQVGSEHGGCDKLKNSLQPSSYDIADVNQWTLLHNQQFPDISVSNMLDQGLGSQNYGSMFPTVNCKSLFPCFNENSTCELPATEQFSSSEKIHWPYGLDFPYDPDPDPGSENLAPLAGVVSGSHALPNGNFSTSQTLSVAVMLELPSLQYPETDLCSWLMSPPTPPIEAVDSHVESPASVQSNSVFHRNSGLLEELLHEAQAMASVESKPSEKSLNSSMVMLSDSVETSPLSHCNTDWNGCSEPVSPLGCSAASVLGAYSPPTGVSSLHESSSGNVSKDLSVKSKYVDDVARQSVEQMETSQLDFSHHDILLGPDRGHNVSKAHDIMSDAIATLLDDLCGEMTCAIATTCVSGSPSPLCQRFGA